jgi:hypothetical protein
VVSGSGNIGAGARSPGQIEGGGQFRDLPPTSKRRFHIDLNWLLANASKNAGRVVRRQSPSTYSHSQTIRDFEDCCKDFGIRILKRLPLIARRTRPIRLLPNWRAEEAVFVISRR